MAGDVLDCWKVIEYEPGCRLRLEARMKLPGRAWLEFQAVAAGNETRILQTIAFEPHGVSGLLYWHLVHPLHTALFAGLLREITRRVESGPLEG